MSVCPSASETTTDLFRLLSAPAIAVDRALLSAVRRWRFTARPADGQSVLLVGEGNWNTGDKLEILLGMIAGTSKIF